MNSEAHQGGTEARSADPPPARCGIWTRCRHAVRWLRIAVLAAILFILGLLTWLRLAGLPEFLRLRVIAALEGRGIIADFRSLRFHWFRGLVAEDLKVAWGGAGGPRFTMEEADVDLAPPPWGDMEELVRGLAVRRGTLQWPLLLTNEPPLELRVEDVAADIRFLEGDAWEVRRLGATALGLRIEMRATITNIARLRRPSAPSDPDAVLQRLRLLRSAIDEARTWSATTPPRLELDLTLDGASPWTAHGDVYFEAPWFQSPRGALRNVRVSLRNHADPAAGAGSRTAGVLEVAEVQTPNGGFVGLSGRIELQGPPAPALPTQAVWEASIEHLFVRGFRGRDLRLAGTNVLQAGAAVTGPLEPKALPLESRIRVQGRRLEIGASDEGRITVADGLVAGRVRHGLALGPATVAELELEARAVSGAPGTSGPVRIQAVLQSPEGTVPAPEGVGGWSRLWPWTGRVFVAATNLVSPRLALGDVGIEADWEPPVLRVSRLDAGLYGGTMRAQGRLDVVNREASVSAETTFDLHGIDGLLGPRSRANFQRYQWKEPPWFQGRAEAVLPAWTEARPDWDGTVKPTLKVTGRFRVGAGAFKGVPFDRAESSLSFDGQNWRLPDLRTSRPEGTQEIGVDYNEDTREYRVDARGVVFPPVLKPILGDRSGEVLDLFRFEHPVRAEVSVWGPWTEGTRQSILGTVAATNLVFRDQRFDTLSASVLYTNRVLIASPLAVSRGTGDLRADGIRYSFDEDRVWITNAVTSIEPAVVAAAIGPSLPEKIAPYRFDLPPVVRVEGTLRPGDTDSADLAFDVQGGPFHFWRMSADQIHCRLLWQGPALVLTNVTADFYRGRLVGHAAFDLTDPADAPYRFEARVRRSSLGDLLREAVPGRTNATEGTFDLDLAVASARTSDIRTWNGHGQVLLEDGLLWDVPIFGFLSPVLNGVVPGLGNNRAEEASATFTLTNGVFHTRDMVIECSPAKLLYRGTIDFDQRVDAKVEGQILSALGGFGPLFGLILRPLTKMLEFRVQGTLADVEAEPLYIPKILLLPIQPMKTLRGWFGPGERRTNGPPAAVPGEPRPSEDR